MSNPDIEAVCEQVKATYREILGELWNPEQDPQLAEAFAQRISKQALLLSMATSPEKQREHRENIAHLRQMMQSEAVIRYMRAVERGEARLETVLDQLVGLAVRRLFGALALST